MKKYRLFSTIYLVAALLLSACSQDELAENSTALPEGEYPLQIGSVSLTAEISEQPWTRVSENPADGMSSVWTHDDKIGVRIGDDEETGIYVVKLDAEGTVMEVVPEKPVYWKDKQPATITAWYPVKEELDFTHQDQGLTYLLQATGDGNYQSTPINLNFTHQLAKVRVKLKGDKACEVRQVYVRSYPKTTNTQGEPGANEGTPDYYPMREANYGGETYWEANLRPGTLQANNSFEVAKEGGTPVRVRLENNVSITAGQVHTINISVNPVIPESTPEITDATGDISGTSAYVVRGNNRTTPINITGGSPTIYLDGATVSVGSDNAINITQNATPTIYVVGENNTIYSSNGAGIYVAQGSTVTITGSSRDDQLTVRGNNGGSGIGGYVISSNNGAACGNITISNVTVISYGSWNSMSGDMAAGIGSAVGASCGAIAIENATVHAYGVLFDPIEATPGIGCGYPMSGDPTSIPVVKISNGSDVHAHRGGSVGKTDYIGWAGSSWGTNANSTINLGGGTCTSSTVYCYTGNGNTVDMIVVYDASGNATQQ